MEQFIITSYDLGIKFVAWIIFPDGNIVINQFTTRSFNQDLR